MKRISHEEWTQRAHAHALLVSPIAEAFLKRRDCRKKHPVHDFLFTYYPFSPTKLKEWVPSFEEELCIEGPEPFSRLSWFIKEGNTVRLNVDRMQGSIRPLASFIATLCDAILEKSPRFGCFGLHEWAMVYRLSKEELRHADYSLRLSPEELATFVESQTLCCTHYDAYRFFTKDAAPRNLLQPTLDTRLQNEQGGCLHANMDLYKWSTKLWPWIGSDFIAKTFALALEGREIDMRASPYDLEKEGYSPIRIETEEGRKEYTRLQQQYAEKTRALRQELKGFCQRLLAFSPLA